MARTLYAGVAVLALAALAWLWTGRGPSPGPAASTPAPLPAAETSPEVVPPPDTVTGGRLFDINVHTEAELELILRRVDALAREAGFPQRQQPIALVLHGPEVAFFVARNYSRYRDLVDLAARLSAYELIDVRMCRTRMREMGIEQEEVPPFIELVPFGPAEVERLQDEGYVVM